MDASEWLEEWVSNNLNTPLYHEHKSAMAQEAEMCRAQADVDGISSQALNDAAGGDLLQFLFDRQIALTDSEVRRQVEKEGN
ncbi:hypothetical protein N8A98_20805 [Devosia neptuniae]|uniref:DUF768 domain-containing protein n=1 Tax=Devosia neptuniae TaxID=191302 RepID=A0ABY6CBM2_9HYPH|nr:hypothetical protein [Devosia neptuniae]UXN69631.1 hypothetical protein N8A98_20805 [Devosia neptuniae]